MYELLTDKSLQALSGFVSLIMQMFISRMFSQHFQNVTKEIKAGKRTRVKARRQTGIFLFTVIDSPVRVITAP